MMINRETKLLTKFSSSNSISRFKSGILFLNKYTIHKYTNLKLFRYTVHSLTLDSQRQASYWATWNIRTSVRLYYIICNNNNFDTPQAHTSSFTTSTGKIQIYHPLVRIWKHFIYTCWHTFIFVSHYLTN